MVCEARGAEVLLGTGIDASLLNFRRLADGDRVVLTPGPQGGQHVWVGLRARGVDPRQARIHLRAYRATDDRLIGQLLIRLPLSPAPEDRTVLALPSQQLVIDDDQYCSVLDGEIRVTLAFNDQAGHCTEQALRLRVDGIDPLASMIDRMARLRCCAERLPRCYPGQAGMRDASPG
jgi:hypothetical protein